MVHGPWGAIGNRNTNSQAVDCRIRDDDGGEDHRTYRGQRGHSCRDNSVQERGEYCVRQESERSINPKVPEPEQSKRIYADLNAEPDTELDREVTAMGGSRMILQNFGSESTSRTDLMKVKDSLRAGRIVRIRAKVQVQHTANVKWLTQTCRTAHRAGVPWALRIKVEKPWEYLRWQH